MVALALGQVICLPCPTRNCNRFYILSDTDKETPSSIAMEISVIGLGEKFFKLKWGLFARASFTCHKFGHLASKCPTLLHQPPPTTMTKDILLIKKQGHVPSVVVKSQDKNAKPHVHARNQATASYKVKDKGKAKLNDNV